MDCEDAQCTCSSGRGWRCSKNALPGISLCQKQVNYKRPGYAEAESSKRIHSESNCEKRVKEAIYEDETDEDDCIELPNDEQANQTPTKDQEDLMQRTNEHDGINPSIIKYISQRAEEVNNVINETIQAKANTLEEELRKEVRKWLINCHDNEEAMDENTGTRFELPFVKRGLERTKYKYALTVIESLTKKSNKSFAHDIFNFGIFSLRRKDLFSMHPTGWLSSCVIGAYATIITDLSTDGTSDVHIMDPFLFNDLQSSTNQFSDMMKCKMNYIDQFKDILDGLMGCDPTKTKILIPVNLFDCHWGLIMMDMLTRTISVLDSKFTKEEATQRYKAPVRLILQDIASAFELRNRANTETHWIIEIYPEDLPKQSNDYDCGLFVLAYMDCIARGEPIMFDSDLSSSRLVILSDLLDHVICGN